eukprot:gene40308-63492_t
MAAPPSLPIFVRHLGGTPVAFCVDGDATVWALMQQAAAQFGPVALRLSGALLAAALPLSDAGVVAEAVVDAQPFDDDALRDAMGHIGFGALCDGALDHGDFRFGNERQVPRRESAGRELWVLRGEARQGEAGDAGGLLLDLLQHVGEVDVQALERLPVRPGSSSSGAGR